MKEFERILKALANRRRLAILVYLKKVPEANVSRISRVIKLSLKSTSRHLSVFEKAGILDKEQRSLEVFYRLALFQKPFVKQLLLEI